MEDLEKATWNGKTYKEFIKLLTSLSDDEYGKFNAKVIPNLGFSYNVRMPILRKIAKHIEKNKDREAFYNFVSSGSSYEEKLLQGILFGKIEFKSPPDMFNSIDYYLKKINNWALCDSFVTNIKPLVIKNKPRFFESAERYKNSENPWAIRFALVLLNSYFTESEYLEDIFEIIMDIRSREYYVNLSVAWLISSCYLVNKERTKEFILEGHLDDWCINKSIQKIVESLRVSADEKETVKKLKKRKTIVLKI